MRRTLKAFVLTIAALLLLGSCNAGGEIVTCYSPREIAEAIILSQDNISPLRFLQPGDDYFSEYFCDIYGIKNRFAVDGVICYADGMLADEIAVFLLPDSLDAADIKFTLNRYKERRLDAFTGYAPAEEAILEKAIAIARGNWVALLICENPRTAETAFLACLGEMPYDSRITTTEKTQDKLDLLETGATAEAEDIKKAENIAENIMDSFDAVALLEARKSGDKSSLSPKNRSVLDACGVILDTFIDDDMSDYDKELAIHDWIIERADYDREVNNNAPDAKPEPDNDNPYGLIIKKKAICTGYTATFQLFMDMLDIECITVEGTSRNTGAEHDWNMVRIDDEWYCVDVTWDDYSGEYRNVSKTHRYFNVTSRYMRDTKHQWDESTTPTADAGKLYVE